MDYGKTLTNWVSRLAAGDSSAMEHVFSRYFDQLVTLAVQKMHGLNQVARSGEDIALSAIKSLYFGLKNEKIQLCTEDDLWGCLFCITVRKTVAERRREFAQKRGGVEKRIFSGNEALNEDDGGELFDRVVGNEPSPQLAAQMAENADELLSLFEENSTQRQIVSMKLQGMTTPEIANHLNLIPRTVFWHLEKIRNRWEFFKGMEYLTENIFQGMSVKKIAVNLEKEEEIIIKILDRILKFWEEKVPEKECQLLRLIWENPSDFEELLLQKDPAAVKLEGRLGKIADQWMRLSRKLWRSDLEKIWSGKL
ncbi:MAG: ECF-type sigma factor [Planctomycetia bacterium]|nr:ECF-type sigma factor [Planctomycetia bacterium]